MLSWAEWIIVHDIVEIAILLFILKHGVNRLEYLRLGILWFVKVIIHERIILLAWSYRSIYTLSRLGSFRLWVL